MNVRTPSVSLTDLMAASGVGFGTSGVRGPVAALTDRVCYACTAAFLQFVQDSGPAPGVGRVALGGDLRPSTDRMMRGVGLAARDRGWEVVHCGRLPAPALALHGLREGMPSIMVTGSHIPADRNGIKFNKATGEISKDDEGRIRAQEVQIPEGLFDARGKLPGGLPPDLEEPEDHASDHYLERYLGFFPRRGLDGLQLGLYEHSAVGRDLLHRILSELGARVTRFGRSEKFVPVDTEAIRAEDVALARRWAADMPLDAIVSTDGDSDRPLVSDETGKWLRGDVAGILCARFLGADIVVAPVSCNTAAERCRAFRQVRRTRIGSPFVIAGMEQACREQPGSTVVGYEANGGFLTATPVRLDGKVLDPLPTRDPVVVIVSLLLLAARSGKPLSTLVAELPPRFMASARLEAYPAEISNRKLAELGGGGADGGGDLLAAEFGPIFGPVRDVDHTDGLRITFASGEIAHLRPSGNAPEFRCYTEADSEERAAEMNRRCLDLMEGWRR